MSQQIQLTAETIHQVTQMFEGFAPVKIVGETIRVYSIRRNPSLYYDIDFGVYFAKDQYGRVVWSKEPIVFIADHYTVK